MKVLIVDGSKQNRRDMMEALTQLTNVVVQGAVAETRTALYAIAESPPDVVVAGMPLPDGDGLHLIDRVRRLARIPSIVVISEGDSRARYLAAGADRFLERGDDLQELQATVATLVRPDRGGITSLESERLLGRLAAGVAHDLNNHLTGLEVSLALIKRSPDDETSWTQLRTVVDSMGRLGATLLDYARGGRPVSEPVDLAAVARHALAIARSTLAPKVQVRLDIDAQLPALVGVRTELEQLLLNLVINASDAMPAGGELAIVARGTGTGILLEVTDTGTGPLEAGLAARTRTGGGLGLGIVHRVVERHGGAIRIAPRTTGGTHVAIVFPAPS